MRFLITNRKAPEDRLPGTRSRWIDFFEHERKRLSGGEFWKSVSVEVFGDGTIALVGVLREGEPARICAVDRKTALV